MHNSPGGFTVARFGFRGGQSTGLPFSVWFFQDRVGSGLGFWVWVGCRCALRCGSRSWLIFGASLLACVSCGLETNKQAEKLFP